MTHSGDLANTDMPAVHARRPETSRRSFVFGGAALGLTLLLGACGSTTSTATTTSGTYTLTVTLSGVSGVVPVTVANSSASTTYTLASGGIISGLYGDYTVSVGAVSGHTTPAAQTVSLTGANGALTFTYTGS